MKEMFLSALFVYSTLSIGAQKLHQPVCPGHRGNIEVNNDQVLEWKQTTKNQWKERAHIEGQVLALYSDRNGHAHFQVQIGAYSADTIEVIYNEDFGELDEVREGHRVRACGDYITSNAPTGRYPASPDGAIIHWVHMNPSDKGHLPGYVSINGRIYGQEEDRRRN